MKRAALLLPLFWASICAFARSADNGAPSGVLTLHECITECLRGNPRLASEQFTLAADKENIWKARSAFLPDLTGHAEIAGLSGSPSGCWALLGINDPDVTGTVETRSASRQAGQTGARQAGRGPFRIGWGWVGTGQLKLEYPLYANSSIFGLNNFPALATAKAQYNKQTWTLRLAEQDVTANLVGVFYSTVAYLNKVELDQQTVGFSKKRLEILQEELRLNLTLPQYVEVAKRQLAANQQVLTTSQERAADSERMLRDLLRRPGTQKLRIWRPLVASTCIIGVALYLIKGVALIWLVPATLLALVVYLLILLLLGMFTESDLRLAKEGLGFVKPFLAKWIGQAAPLK
jgi:outer membrane protein TolC